MTVTLSCLHRFLLVYAHLYTCTVVRYNFLQMDMQDNGIHRQQMTAVVVVAVNGTSCCRARLHKIGCSSHSGALSK